MHPDTASKGKTARRQGNTACTPPNLGADEKKRKKTERRPDSTRSNGDTGVEDAPFPPMALQPPVTIPQNYKQSFNKESMDTPYQEYTPPAHDTNNKIPHQNPQPPLHHQMTQMQTQQIKEATPTVLPPPKPRKYMPPRCQNKIKLP